MNLVEAEDLGYVILAGHSYAGNVIAAASEHITDRISAVVYLDSYVPADDDKFIDFEVTDRDARAQAKAQFDSGVYGIEPFPFLVDRFGWARICTG